MEKTQAKKPKWLRRLEQESWQAELIISGIAIYGSLQLPDLLDASGSWLYGSLPPEANLAVYLFFTYSFMAAYLLILSFIAHFILRTVWVGLIGLNSVFPHGIREDGGWYPRHFMERLKKDVDYGDGLLRQLDEISSMVFSLSTTFVMIFVAVAIDVIVLFLLWLLLSMFLPEAVIKVVFLVVLLVFLLLLILVYVFNHKKLREKAWAKRWHFPIFQVYSKLFFHVFYRPINYLSFTFFSNLNVKKYFAYTFGFLVVTFIAGGGRLFNSSVLHFAEEDMAEVFYDRPDRLDARNYENLRRPDHGRILSAILEADRISGNSLRVFVPVFGNEDFLADEICGEFTPPDGEEAARKLRRQFNLDCLARRHRFYLNDSLYQPKIWRHTHDNLDERGIITYLPTAALEPGPNLLAIEKIGPDSGEVFRRASLPFWFEGQ